MYKTEYRYSFVKRQRQPLDTAYTLLRVKCDPNYGHNLGQATCAILPYPCPMGQTFTVVL